MPERVQRRRAQGEPGMPDGAVYVGRPTKWGNPWRVVKAGREPGLFGGQVTVYTVDGPGLFFRGTNEDPTWAAEYAVTLYRDWINGRSTRYRGAPEPLDADIRELRGRDLACWCAPDQPCHGDVLLELANG